MLAKTQEEFFERVFSNIGLEEDGTHNVDYNLLIETSDGNVFPYHAGSRDNKNRLFKGLVDGLGTLRAYVDWDDISNYFEKRNGTFPVYLTGGKAIRIAENYEIEEEILLSKV